MGADLHHPHHQAKTRHAVCAIVTVSDTRTPESDASGVCIRALLEEARHRVLSYTILPDDPGGLRAHLEDGFGELFRMLSYQQVGSAAMLSRAVAGVARGKIVVSLPGAPAAVELAMQKLLLPELGHLIHLVRG